MPASAFPFGTVWLLAMTYNIWLGNPYRLHYKWDALCTEVASLFSPAIGRYDRTHTPRLERVRCRSTMQRPQLGRLDLLVYVVPIRDFGFGGVDFAPNAGGRGQDNAGFTVTSAGDVCSEVYVGDMMQSGSGIKLRADFLTTDPPEIEVNVKRDPKFLAKIIYHEALHNRTDRGDALHAIAGLSIGAATFGETDSLSEADRTVMARNLDRTTTRGRRRRPLTQWTGGWTAANSR